MSVWIGKVVQTPLVHAVNGAKRAYRRSSLLERHRVAMQPWAECEEHENVGWAAGTVIKPGQRLAGASADRVACEGQGRRDDPFR